jgi:penicillin G amidase
VSGAGDGVGDVLEAGPDPREPTPPRRRHRRWPAVLAWTAGVLALLLIVVTVTAGWLVQRSFPQTEGTLALAGLDDDVRVLRNAWGVSDVYASTAHDLFFAQGYVHAQDRFWEMDVRRHITAGRLSEMFGDTGLDTDEFVRTLGWRRVAEQELALMSAETRDALDAYAEGVNAYLADRPESAVSFEYAVLGLTNRGYTIEPWTPVDSLAWLKAMAWDLRSNMVEETQRALLTPVVGSRVRDLYPLYPTDRNPSIVTSGAVRGGRFVPSAGGRVTVYPQPGLPVSSSSVPSALVSSSPVPSALVSSASGPLRSALSGMRQLDDWLAQYGKGVGSNSWAVTGDRSATGGAILSNDPHLAPTLPGIWYQMGLHCTSVSDACPYQVAGYTFSGVPGVIIGHNDHVAWGFTNLGPDVADLYYEAVSGDQVVRDGELVPLETRQETIEVAGGDPVTITVRSTDNGPLVSDVDDEQADVASTVDAADGVPAGADEVAVALRWTALQPGTTGDAILAIDRARDFDQFREAARLFQVPSQNMLYAGVDGHIGYQAPGLVPVRATGDGTTPQPGWDTRTRWRGFIPFAALPYAYDPPEQLIATANNQVVDPTRYPFLLTRDWSYGYRASRIVQELATRVSLTVDDMTTLQMNSENGFASTLAPWLSGAAHRSEEVPAVAADLLESWDFDQQQDSAGAAFYNACWRHLLARTFGDELTGDLAPDGSDRWFEVVRSLLEQPSSVWWDDVRTEKVERLDDMLTAAVTDAYAELADRLGDDPTTWRWGDLHTLELRSPTFGESGVAPLEMLFNRGPISTSGGESIVNATGWNAPDGYAVTWVPSMRMVVDLEDLDASRWIHLTGQSGHVFSPHYWDQAALWRDGKTLPWAFGADAVAAAAADELVLTPQG